MIFWVRSYADLLIVGTLTNAPKTIENITRHVKTTANMNDGASMRVVVVALLFFSFDKRVSSSSFVVGGGGVRDDDVGASFSDDDDAIKVCVVCAEKL